VPGRTVRKSPSVSAFLVWTGGSPKSAWTSELEIRPFGEKWWRKPLTMEFNLSSEDAAFRDEVRIFTAERSAGNARSKPGDRFDQAAIAAL